MNASAQALFKAIAVPEDEWPPSMPQSHGEAAGGAPKPNDRIGLAEPTQLDQSHRINVINALSGRQQEPEQESSLVSGLRVAYMPASANSALADSGLQEPEQSAAPDSELSSVFDFL